MLQYLELRDCWRPIRISKNQKGRSFVIFEVHDKKYRDNSLKNNNCLYQKCKIWLTFRHSCLCLCFQNTNCKHKLCVFTQTKKMFCLCFYLGSEYHYYLHFVFWGRQNTVNFVIVFCVFSLCFVFSKHKQKYKTQNL